MRWYDTIQSGQAGAYLSAGTIADDDELPTDLRHGGRTEKKEYELVRMWWKEREGAGDGWSSLSEAMIASDGFSPTFKLLPTQHEGR